MHNALNRQLTASQREAVFHIEGPLLVLAGPGSGKTRVITYRIAALIDSGVRPHNICAITFTNKAAEEMRQRAVAVGASSRVHISTFHSLCVRILRQYCDKAGINPNFNIYDESDQAKCVKQALKDLGLDTTNFSPARMLEAISVLKNKLIDAESFKEQIDGFFTKTLADVYEKYQNILNDNNCLDFDDLLMKVAFLLRDYSDVCNELGHRFRFLLIDEYQDTNHAQYQIARALASHHGNICATGDPDQSIYRWRGADIRNILAFEKDWPNARVVRLEENFRSTANILALADNLISFNRNRKEKKLIPTKPGGEDVVIDSFEDENIEAQAVAGQIRKLVDQGASFNSIAVFYRVNAMSRVFEEIFIRSGVPYEIVRGVEFYRRKEIRDFLAYLKAIVNPDDEIALLRIINTPTRGIGKTTIDKISSFAAVNHISFYNALKKAGQIESLPKAAKARLAVFVNMLENFKKDISGPVAAMMGRVFTESGLEDSLRSTGPQGQNAIENINELINTAAAYDQNTEQPSLSDYLQQISLFSDVDAYDASSNRVALMTLHAAKGLEFDNVFIVGLEHGILPHERSTTGEDADDMEEERRLFFVGLTRAKARLYISYAQYRTVRGQMLRTIPSQFLTELGHEMSSEPAQQEHYYENDIRDDYNAPRFEPGQLVRHKTFGLGRIVKYSNMGESSIAVVKFNSGQTKSLLLKYADLLKVDI